VSRSAEVNPRRLGFIGVQLTAAARDERQAATLAQQQAASGSSSWGDIEKQVREPEHPTLARAIAVDPGFSHDQQFEQGLNVVLLGMRSML